MLSLKKISRKRHDAIKARYFACNHHAVGALVLCFHHIPPKRRLCLTFPAGSADLSLLENDKVNIEAVYRAPKELSSESIISNCIIAVSFRRGCSFQ
ncbi:hypothetical protein Y032_0558g3418 [Ancylostoma ceylanicum]|uniref:Uncharacterized protein n=1 Tax=Ancylostoma ceylanicum TaxID=53326 RepID=A0A016WQ69_9BILA|nr:hypothetical protein Y032_0558g3418 [Ancylostoma ceylanicum]